jgi:hypothetical protein
VGWQNWLFGFCRRVGFVCGGKSQCAIAGRLKLVLKNVRGQKNKKHRVGKSVGLFVVRLQYRFYVFGHLSKWFTFFYFCHSSV